MKRRLLLINALLAGVLILGAAELYRGYIEAEQRHARLEELADPKQPPAYTAPSKPNDVRAANYLPIVDRFLFSPDRNATVIVEVAPEPEIVRPPLPYLTALVDLGNGPTALMTADEEEPPRWVGLNEKIGEFEFKRVQGNQVMVAWRDQEFVVEEAEERPAPRGRTKKSGRTKSTGSRPPSPGPAQPVAPPTDLASGPAAVSGGGIEMGREINAQTRAVARGDNTPEGTESDGYVKTVNQTPFGPQTFWKKKPEDSKDDK